MENMSICTVIPVERPKRKLIYLPSKSATGYLSYCEEVGCDWEGLQNSIPEKFDTAAILELPEFLQEYGYSNIASGVEVPLDYSKPFLCKVFLKTATFSPISSKYKSQPSQPHSNGE